MKAVLVLNVAAVGALWACASVAAAGDPGPCETPREPAAGAAEAAVCATPMAPPAGECVVTAEGPIEIPFRVLNHHVLVPVSVNGSPPLDLILDTGMPVHGVMLHPCPEVDAIEFSADGAPEVAVAGGGADTVQRVATGVTLEIPGAVFHGQLAIIASPCGPARTLAPEEARGVIGLSLFHNFVVTFDHDRGVLVLTRPEAFAYAGQGVRLPIRLGQRPIPEVDCTLSTGEREIPLRLAIDTGATHALSLTLTPQSDITPPASARPLVIGYSYWGELSGLVGRGGALRLGDLVLDDILVTYLQAGAPGVPTCGFDGLLGNVTLRRFNVTFDYSRREMILEPNSHTAEPFEFNMSGVACRRGASGGFEVFKVFPETPGSEAGILPGDVIVEIDGRPSGEIPSDEMRAMFERDGASLTLGIARRSEVVDVTVRLRRLV